MQIFSLSDDIQRVIFSNWLNIVDLSRFDVALCNHSLRTNFFAFLASNQLYLPGTLTTHKESSLTCDQFYEEYPKIHYSEGIANWMTKRASHPRCLLVDDNWSKVSSLKSLHLLTHFDSIDVFGSSILKWCNANNLLRLGVEYEEFFTIADISPAMFPCLQRLAVCTMTAAYDVDIFSPLARFCRSAQNLSRLYVINHVVTDPTYFIKLIREDFGPFLRKLRFQICTDTEYPDEEIQLPASFTAHTWLRNLDYIRAELAFITLALRFCSSLKIVECTNSSNMEMNSSTLRLFVDRIRERTEPLDTLIIAVEEVDIGTVLADAYSHSIVVDCFNCNIAIKQGLYSRINDEERLRRDTLRSLTLKSTEDTCYTSFAELSLVRHFYPNLEQLILSNLSIANTPSPFVLNLFPFRRLLRLELIDCNLVYAAIGAKSGQNRIIVDDLVTNFQQLRVLRWDGLGLEDDEKKILLRGLVNLKRLSLTRQRCFEQPGPHTKQTLASIAAIRPTIRHLQLQIWKDLDMESLVAMLTACKEHLETFEIYGKIEDNDRVANIALEALKLWMRKDGKACSFKVLPKYYPEAPVELSFESF